MSEETISPCEVWTTPTAVVGCEECDDFDDEVALQDACDAAGEALLALSANVYTGKCTKTIRPPSAGGPIDVPSPPHSSFGVPIVNWPWVPWTWDQGCGYGNRSCTGTPVIDLKTWPVTAVTGVSIDGEALPLSTLRIDDERWLIRQDGVAWPCCQDMSKAIGEAGTWSVTIEHGVSIPKLGNLAAAELACQLALLLAHDEECRLNQRVIQEVRRNVTLSLLDPTKLLTEGRTGLYFVDLFLQTVNPHGLLEPPTVVTANSRPNTTTTWTGA